MEIFSRELIFSLLNPRRIFARLDQLNWLLVFLLLLWAGVGLTLLLSADGGIWPWQDSPEANHWVKKQAIRLLFGLAIMIAIALTDIRLWLNLAYPLYGICLVLLIAVDLIGHVGMGAQRWIGFGGIVLQPSEIMKVAIILAIARYCHALSGEDIAKARYLVIPAVMIILPALLVIRQPDLGTAILLVAGGGAVVFLAGIRMWKVLTLVGVVLAALPLAWNYILHDYQKNRVLTFLNPENDPLGAGYHITQSKIALGAGGILGRGFQKGTQSKYNFLPEKHTDFIFTLLGEEFGFVGTIGLLLLFIAIIVLASIIAFRVKSQFGRLVAMGLTANFAFYVLINISMVTGLVPVVGVPLPIISYGGTAILSVMVGFGLILMIDLDREQPLAR